MSRNNPRRMAVQRMTRTSVMLAAALALSLLESVLPPLPAPVPLRYGLANVAVMAALLFIGPFEAVSVALLKSVFVLMTRGLIAGSISFTGTLLSVGVMVGADFLLKRRTSVFLLSVLGAIAHNAGQLFFLVLFLQYKLSVLFIGPYLLFFGVLTGLLSGALLFICLRPLEAFFRASDRSGGKDSGMM